MNRLTIRNSDGSVSQPTNLNWAKALERLAEYEDTGLTPDEVEHLKRASMGKAIAEIKEFSGVSVERLCELAESDKAANVEPVVRSKDCKKSSLTEFGKRYCSEPMGAFYGCIPVEDSFFCSGGKRLEENE